MCLFIVCTLILSDKFPEGKLLMRTCVFFNFNKLHHVTLQEGCNLLLPQTCIRPIFPPSFCQPRKIATFSFVWVWRAEKIISLLWFVFPCLTVYLFIGISSSGNDLFHLWLIFNEFYLSHAFAGVPCRRDRNPPCMCYVLPLFSLSLSFVSGICLWCHFPCRNFELLCSWVRHIFICWDLGFHSCLRSPTCKFIWIFSHICSTLFL